MQYTENYSMNKPQFGENALVTKLNENADTLDTLIYNTRQMQADSYDSTQTYNTGDLVSYNSALYICLADNVTGTWDSTKWSATTLSEQVELAKQSGGGQVTKEVSGNPIELTDAANAPMVKCVTEIQGSQDLHGYDKPWVGGTGKNKLPLVLADIKSANTGGVWSGSVYTYYGITFTVESFDGYVNAIKVDTSGATGTALFRLSNGTNLDSASYYLNGCPANGSLNTYLMRVYDTSDNIIATDTGNGSQFTSGNIGKSEIRIASGAIINNLTFYPMIRLSTVTDPTFAPYSNICPITAYTEGEIEVRGKNLFDPSVFVPNKSINEQGEEVSSSGFRIYGPYRVNAGETITISYDTVATAAYTRVHAFNSSGEWLSQIIAVASNTVTRITQNFITPSNCKYIKISTNSSFTNFQLEKGSSATTYEPYTSTTHTTTYPSAIYRGSEDVVDGEVTSEWAYATLSGGNDENWIQYTSRNGDPYFVVRNKLTDAPIISTTGIADAITSQYPIDTASNVYKNNIAMSISGDGSTIYDPQFTSLTDLKTALANNPIEIAYRLATPTTSSVTPTNLPIRTLSGYTHIESSTGDMEVEYITQDYQPLVDLIQSGTGHTYSTSEQVVGKWIDGKDLYECTFVGQSVTSNAWSIDVTSIGIENAFIQSGFVMLSNNIPININEYFSPTNYSNSHFESGYIKGNLIGYTGVPTVTLRYTKSTTTRSLSTPLTSQKAQIETDNTEEVPTEEEKAVNEEENTNENR